MDRRNFLTAMFCIAGATIAAATAPAEAIALLTPPVSPDSANAPAAAVATEADMAQAEVQDAYWVYRRRRHWRRRFYYRPVYRYRRRRFCSLRRDWYGRLYRRCY